MYQVNMEFLEYLVLLTLITLLLKFLMDFLPAGTETFKNSSERLEDDAVWDEFYSKVYDQLFSIPERLQMEWTVIEEALSTFPKSKIDVLDVGCGTAPQAKSILDYKPNSYTELDNSPYMINKARESNSTKDGKAKFVGGCDEWSDVSGKIFLAHPMSLFHYIQCAGYPSCVGESVRLD
jgi:SAM-dependent methyltransferase